MTPQQPSSVERLLGEWHYDANLAQDAHSDAADHYVGLDLRLGGGAAVLAALIGTSVFATLQQDVAIGVRVAAGVVTLAAATLSGLQTFLKAAARGETHRQASRRYGAIIREIEQLQSSRPPTAERERELDKIRTGMDAAGREAPNVPPKVWKRAEKALQAKEAEATTEAHRD